MESEWPKNKTQQEKQDSNEKIVKNNLKEETQLAQLKELL